VYVIRVVAGKERAYALILLIKVNNSECADGIFAAFKPDGGFLQSNSHYTMGC